jgi:hypothetical protein
LRKSKNLVEEQCDCLLFFEINQLVVTRYGRRKEYIKLILGLSLSRLITNKNLSLFGLAKITNLSKSYLNEIEKVKISQNR